MYRTIIHYFASKVALCCGDIFDNLLALWAIMKTRKKTFSYHHMLMRPFRVRGSVTKRSSRCLRGSNSFCTLAFSTAFAFLQRYLDKDYSKFFFLKFHLITCLIHKYVCNDSIGPCTNNSCTNLRNAIIFFSETDMFGPASEGNCIRRSNKIFVR